MIRRPLHLILFTALLVMLGFGCNTGSGRRSFGPGSTGANGSGGGGGGGGGGGSGVGSLTAAAPMSLTRALHTATVLTTGNVLVVCGEDNLGFHSTSELYDATADAWARVDQIAPTQSAGLMIEAATGNPTFRSRHSATLLPNGQVLIVGGYGAERNPPAGPVIEALSSSYLFNPATLTFTQTVSPGLHANRHSHLAELISTTQVVVTAGMDNSGPFPLQGGGNQIGTTITSTEVYDVNTGMWSTVAPSGGTHTTGAAGVVGGTLFVVGGADVGFTDGGGFIVGAAAFSAPRVESFDPNNAIWGAATGNNEDRAQPAYVVTSNGSLFLAGGRDANLVIVNTTEYLDAGNNAWVVGPPLATGRAGAEAAELASTSDVLITGGFDAAGTTVLRQCEVYGVLSNAMLGTVDMTDSRIMHRAVTLNDGRILIVGGLDNTNTYLQQCELHSR